MAHTGEHAGPAILTAAANHPGTLATMQQRTLRSTLGILVITCVAVALSACASPGVGRDIRTLQSDDYIAAFNAARDALRGRGFELARVDAREGVIQTYPASSSGLLTPWRRHITDTDSAVRGVLHHEQRIARVTFSPAGATPEPGDDPPDLREWDGGIAVRVEVIVQSFERPGTRPDPTSVRLASTTTGRTAGEPDLTAQPIVTPAGRDPELARAIAGDIANASATRSR